MSVNISFAIQNQQKYDALVERFESGHPKERYDFVERVILCTPWHRKQYRQLFIERVLASEIFNNSEVKSLKKLYGRVCTARALRDTSAWEARPKSEMSVFELRGGELSRIQVLCSRWKCKMESALRVASAVSAEVSEQKKDILRDEKEVLTILEHSLVFIDQEVRYKAFIATRSGDAKIQGVALVKDEPKTRALYLAGICTHPNNLGVLERNEYTLSGVGSALMVRVIAYAVDHGYSTIELVGLNTSDEWYKRRFGFCEVPNSDLLSLDLKGMKAVLKQQ